MKQYTTKTASLRTTIGQIKKVYADTVYINDTSEGSKNCGAPTNIIDVVTSQGITFPNNDGISFTIPSATAEIDGVVYIATDINDERSNAVVNATLLKSTLNQFYYENYGYVEGGSGGGVIEDGLNSSVNTIYFASDVRSAQMTHAIWRGNVSFEIGGVSYVHGRNMFIADDGMSVSFTGEDKPTKRAVNEALNQNKSLTLTLVGNQLDITEYTAVEGYDSIRLFSIPYPISPLQAIYRGEGMYSAKLDIYAPISSHLYKNGSTDDDQITYKETAANNVYVSVVDDYDLWGEVGSTTYVKIVCLYIDYGYVRLKEFSQQVSYVISSMS